MSKLIINSDNNKKSQKIKKFLLSNKIAHTKKFNLIIVIGGDGFMQQTLKKNNKRTRFTRIVMQ